MVDPISASEAPSHLPLPRWVYVPGRGGDADRETLDQVKALAPDRFDGIVPDDHPALRYGLVLNDAGFYWECHEILEALWKVAPQGGRDRILLRACIQIANANLKQAMNQPRAAARLFAEALAELDELGVRAFGDRAGFAGHFPANTLADAIRSTVSGEANGLAVRILLPET